MKDTLINPFFDFDEKGTILFFIIHRSFIVREGIYAILSKINNQIQIYRFKNIESFFDEIHKKYLRKTFLFVFIVEATELKKLRNINS